MILVRSEILDRTEWINKRQHFLKLYWCLFGFFSPAARYGAWGFTPNVWTTTLRSTAPPVPTSLCLAATVRAATRYISHFGAFHTFYFCLSASLLCTYLSCHSLATSLRRSGRLLLKCQRFLLTPKNELPQLIHTRKLLSAGVSSLTWM